MGRNATLRIENQTGHELVYRREKTKDGDYKKNSKPPKSIRAGSVGKFEVTDKGLKGPSSYVVYGLADSS